MTWTDLAGRMQARFLPFSKVNRLRIRTKLLAVLIPSVVGILLVTGYVTYVFSQQYLQEALERIGIVQTLAVAKALEDTLAQGRRDLLFFVAQAPEPAAMRDYLERLNDLRPFPYREFGYLDLEGHDHVFFDTIRDRVVRVPGDAVEDIRPSPFRLLEQGRELVPGQAGLGPIVRLDYHLTLPSGSDMAVANEIIRIFAPRTDDAGKVRGVYILSLGARDLRNILSLYNSAQSPLHGFERSPELRYSFLFDTEGWVLFQSAEPDKPQVELTTYLARSGYSGTLGRRGMESAFRPEALHKDYWRMVYEVREGKSGIIDDGGGGAAPIAGAPAAYMPFAPVRFKASEDAMPRVFAGVAYMDKSRMTLRAGYKQVDVVFIITLSAMVLVTGIITLLSRAITRPIIELARSVSRIRASGEIAPVTLPDHDHETSVLKNAVNSMIAAIRRQVDEIESRDRKIEQVRMREKASPEPAPAGVAAEAFPEIKGTGPLMERLRAQLAKAAQVDADVLVTGETGTGKQLVAEAVHRHSRRAKGPFISINCGALDENLLLDTLFGHVKGAFTEARAERKGAFLEADGGVLFLDEIQSATPKVQQALLRAIAMRRIRPLGSDRELAIDVRLVAATNVDLREASAKGRFREDLYFRLNVIAVATPPLRRHKMSISVLAHHFLAEAGASTDKRGLGLSRGALAKLIAYDWPGNIRELKHCILRAAVMSEHSVIQDTDLLLEGDTGAPSAAAAGVPREPDAVAADAVADEAARGSRVGDAAAPGEAAPDVSVLQGLGPRQAALLPRIAREGRITRARYQELAGGIPQRTAAHDLRQLVDKGLLVRRGSGPATRYEPTEAALAALGNRDGTA
ncbi:sigma 54-interacting transcriptional regulator [Solidesulfovibrio alcoholivorans]|uniref:sigma 54-interacting transcriptional regulator n=1 Tax=Solidesulfovibrio alcoholivorans TaxID=81406 RepID=UPI0006932679|nr:sigma 54-interacting transcriptional regulator [Solidesulfovibrio alcoholivorans]